MIRLLIFFGLIYILYRAIRILIAPSVRPKTDNVQGVVNPMVQDPFCRTYIPLREAIKKVIEGKEYFFCSNECLEKFENEHKRGTSL